MSPRYDPALVSDDDELGDNLRLIIARCPDLASSAMTALRLVGVNRQVRYDTLVGRALETAEWTPAERLALAAPAGAGIMDEGGRRTIPVQVKLTQAERDQLGIEAEREGLSLSDFIRRRVLG